MTSPYSNVIGFDDAPFERDHRGDVMVVGVVCSRTRLDGVVSTRVRRDGANATDRMCEALQSSQFAAHVKAVLLQGIAVAGFNVIDMHRMHRKLGIAVLAVARRMPNFPKVKRALETTGPGWPRKWALIERAGEMERAGNVYVQRAGLSLAEAKHLLSATTFHGNLPEALRLAHLIAGGVTTGASRGRA